MQLMQRHNALMVVVLRRYTPDAARVDDVEGLAAWQMRREDNLQPSHSVRRACRAWVRKAAVGGCHCQRLAIGARGARGEQADVHAVRPREPQRRRAQRGRAALPAAARCRAAARASRQRKARRSGSRVCSVHYVRHMVGHEHRDAAPGGRM